MYIILRITQALGKGSSDKDVGFIYMMDSICTSDSVLIFVIVYTQLSSIRDQGNIYLTKFCCVSIWLVSC